MMRKLMIAVALAIWMAPPAQAEPNEPDSPDVCNGVPVGDVDAAILWASTCVAAEACIFGEVWQAGPLILLPDANRVNTRFVVNEHISVDLGIWILAMGVDFGRGCNSDTDGRAFTWSPSEFQADVFVEWYTSRPW